MTRKVKIQRTIDDFLRKFSRSHAKDNIKIEGILIAGSFLDKEKVSKNSDLDLFIVIKNNNFRYRGMDYINGIYVDYFVNPLNQLKHDLNKVKDSSGNTLANALANGQIFLDKSNNLLKLQKLAKKIIANTYKSKLPFFRITLNKYFIDDYLKDIEDSYAGKDFFAWQYNVSILLNYLIEVFCRFHKIHLVKPKYQKDEISKKYPKFIDLYNKVAGASNRIQKMLAIKKLSDYVLIKLGGRLSKRWEIKSRCES